MTVLLAEDDRELLGVCEDDGGDARDSPGGGQGLEVERGQTSHQRAPLEPQRGEGAGAVDHEREAPAQLGANLGRPLVRAEDERPVGRDAGELPLDGGPVEPAAQLELPVEEGDVLEAEIAGSLERAGKGGSRPRVEAA